jgi:hypothetical protein
VSNYLVPVVSAAALERIKGHADVHEAVATFHADRIDRGERHLDALRQVVGNGRRKPQLCADVASQFLKAHLPSSESQATAGVVHRRIVHLDAEERVLRCPRSRRMGGELGRSRQP